MNRRAWHADEERRQKRARNDLTGLVKRLRRTCGKIKNADEWINFVQAHVEPLLEANSKVLTGATIWRIENATRLMDTSRDGINRACKVLQYEIEKTIYALPEPVQTPVLRVLLGGLVAAAVVVGGGAILLNQMAASLNIVNNGCAPIDLATYQFLNSVPGVQVPESIETNGEEVLTLMPVAISIDTRDPGEFKVDALGIPVTGEVDNLESIRLDDTNEIFGLKVPLALKPRAEHRIQLNCK